MGPPNGTAGFWASASSSDRPPDTVGADRLELLGFRGSRVDLLRYITVHPRERVHLRRLEQLFGPKSASFQRDLRALVELGALRRIDGAARRVEYELVTSWQVWPVIRSLIAELSSPVALVREALRGVSGVDAAFVYGSHANGRARPDSDVDVFVLGDALDRRALHRSLAEVAMLTGRQVNPGLYTRMKLAERLGRPASPSRRFLRDVLAGPKTWVAGDEAALLPLAIAAAIPMPAPLSA
jgi:predicted nucleotidyltransferase